MSFKNLRMKDLPMTHSVSGVTSDSRKVESGFIFVAVKGVSQDGHEYVLEAQSKGAAIVVGEVDSLGAHLDIPYVQVADSAQALAELSADFYENPSRSLLVVGITGTSGKTTTSYVVESILKAAGHKVGLIGTVQIRYGSQVIEATHTTPAAVEIQKLLFEMKQAGCTAVVMEVSSHALKQKRVSAISFDGMIFTNLSPEHLDYHSDMEDYFRSKSILFTDLAQYSIHQGKRPVACINSHDGYGKRLFEEIKVNHPREFTVLGFASDAGLVCAVDGISGMCAGVPIRSALVGQFNGANIAAAVTLAKGIEIDVPAIEQGVSQLVGVPGRLERVINQQGVHIWVDYAHKPDALEKVILTLRAMRAGRRLITVFGCGGDRDRKKRPVMGGLAVRWSDLVWITSDNPRTEDPMAIIHEIIEGTVGFNNFTVQIDRKKAICEAIKAAKSGDLVLIEGKGHEDYQIIGTQKTHFDDREVALQAIRC